MRLIVARCEVDYTGRLTARLPEALRLLMINVRRVVHGPRRQRRLQAAELDDAADGDREDRRRRGRKRISVRKLKGDDRLEVVIHEVISDVTHDMGEGAALEKDGVEARPAGGCWPPRPSCCGEGFRLVRREWPTDIGPVDLMCRDDEDGWIAVEIKRIGTIDAVEQLTPLPRAHPPRPGAWRTAAASSPPRRSSHRPASSPSRARIAWVEVDLAVLRGEREPELTLFGT